MWCTLGIPSSTYRNHKIFQPCEITKTKKNYIPEKCKKKKITPQKTIEVEREGWG